MTVLLIALVGALFIVNLAQLWVTRHAIDRANEARIASRCDLQQREEASVENARLRGEVDRLRTRYCALLKRQQNRRDAAVQSGPLTGVIPDARD